jgi:hypothetical protein
MNLSAGSRFFFLCFPEIIKDNANLGIVLTMLIEKVNKTACSLESVRTIILNQSRTLTAMSIYDNICSKNYSCTIYHNSMF